MSLTLLVVLSVLLGVGAPAAIAGVPPGEDPSPTPEPIPSSEPSPSPEPTPSPSPEPSPSQEPSPPPDPSPSASPSPEVSPTVRGSRILPAPGRHPSERSASLGEDPELFDQPLHGGSPHHGRTRDLSTEQLLGGTFSTERLAAAAARLRAAGWSHARIRREVYAPFILVGPASWGDSWHAPRRGPGPIERLHEGQDVLCRYGAEVLAPEDGTIAFDSGLLGGRSAHLYLPDGGYYYFAHFVDWNDRRFSDGDQVRRGDVIGYCGDTGNATVPHVHFGRYGADGAAIDPMRRLISWLHQAESHLPKMRSAPATRAQASSEIGVDDVRTLRDPLPEVGRLTWRSTSSSEPYGALDLTPVIVFLMFIGLGRWTGPGSRRRRIELRSGSPPRSSMWDHRRGPVVP